ncbi:MAG: hypothetical protein AB8B82_17310 [Roseovarius sp.]
MFSVSAARASDAPFDVDHIKCGQASCAYVYQGEGVSHPQLIAHLYQTGLASDDFTYIFDYPPNQPNTISFYINNSLEMHMGSSPSVTLSPDALMIMLENAAVIIEGAELAFNNPYTYDLGFWPTMSEWAEIVDAQQASVPNAIVSWDVENGTIDPPEGTGTGHTGNTVGGLVILRDCDIDQTQPGCGVEFGDTGSAAAVTDLAAPGLTEAERRFARGLRDRMAPALERGQRQRAINRLRARTDPQALNPFDTECSNDQLQDEQSEQTCRDRCDMCETMDMAVDGAEGAVGCGIAVVGIAKLTAVPTDGLSVVALLFGGSAATATCTGAWVGIKSIHRSRLKKACTDQCAYYFN